MPRGTSTRGYTCKVCQQVMPSFGALGRHTQTHTPDERAARAGFTGTPTPRVAKHRIEDAFGAGPASPDPGTPSPEPDPSPVSGDGPAGPAPSPRASRATVAAPSIRISPEQRSASVADAVRDALPIATVADLLIGLSRAISDLDGAGEAGVLSPIQATQVASLLYDSTVDLVISRFGGDVTRFKAGLAITIILISKGKIHAQAVGARIAERRAIAKGKADAAVLTGATAGEAPTGMNGHAPKSLDDLAAEARERQAAMIASLPG